MVHPGPDANNRIEELHNDHRSLVDYLQSNGQLLLQSRAQDAFSKTLIVAVASYFEVRLTQAIVDLYLEATGPIDILAQFVKRQAIGRRFSQLFNWGNESRHSQNANGFYRLFGSGFADYMIQKVRDDESLDDSVKAFLEIGNLRNQMLHEDFADFQLNKTVDDVYSLYQTATTFVERFPIEIRGFMGTRQSQDSI